MFSDLKGLVQVGLRYRPEERPILAVKIAKKSDFTSIPWAG